MEGLSRVEMRALRALCDAFLPADASAWRSSIAERCASVLLSHPDPDALARARLFLRLLEIAPASFALGGTAFAPFSRLAAEDATLFLGRLAGHPLGLARGAFQALKRLITVTYYGDVDEGSADPNPTWSRLGYPGPVLRPSAPRKLVSMRIERDTKLQCDVVIVGSGAGGSVVAAELSAAGQDVIVLEKGGHHETGDIDQLEMPSFRRLYLDAGLSATADQGTVVLAGSCLGGGTVVNYTTSFATPERVREEWSRVSGLDIFTSASFGRSLDAVCARLGVNTDHSSPSSRDALMEAGLRANGWHVAALPRNVMDCTQDEVCGYCGLGCARDAKRSTLRTYLEDAAAGRTRFIVECDAQRVLVERGAAVGVEARSASGARLTVHARAVVASAGAINTPALLLRSGLGGEVGAGLRLHPATAVWGAFDHDVRPWTGTVQALYSYQLADLDGDGYGVHFETAPIHPGFQAIGAAWGSAAQFDATMSELGHTSLIGLLLRDRDGGRVTVARSGRPVLRYSVSRYDQRHVRRAIDAGARVLRAAGARRVRATTSRPVVLDSGTVDAWMDRIDRVGYGPNQTAYVTFHQMGSCRMGADRGRGAVDGSGQSHEVKRLFVADGSLFPTASGVNPMISIMALAHHVAQEMKAVL